MRFDLYVYNTPLGQWAQAPVASVNSTVGEVLLGRAVKGAASAFGERWVAVYDKSKQSWAVWDASMQVAGYASAIRRDRPRFRLPRHLPTV